jgi:hypothetical protein
MQVSRAAAKKLGIDADYCGTITASSVPDLAATAEHSQKVKLSLLKEREGTSELLGQLKILGLPEPRSLFHKDGQYRFHPVRRWKFDVCWPDEKLAIEIQGINAHTKIDRFAMDSEKICTAQAMRWFVFPVLYRDIRNGSVMAWIEQWWKGRSKP